MLRQLSITLIYILLPVTSTSCLFRVHQLSAQELPVLNLTQQLKLKLEICHMIEKDSRKATALLKSRIVLLTEAEAGSDHTASPL